MQLCVLALALFHAPAALAADGGGDVGLTFLAIAVLLMLGKIAGLVERFGQPAVLGELLVGIALGNLPLLGVPGTRELVGQIAGSGILRFLAELGVVILLFQIGLESNVATMRRVGAPALLVAVIGVLAPMALGTYVVGPWLLPELGFDGHLFLGATLTATSVGITGRVFRDLGILRSREAQIVLGAAVIDDVLGLMILALVSAIVTSGGLDVLSVVAIAAKALVFLVGALVLGHAAAPRFSRLFSMIDASASMKVAVLVSTCLTFAWAASAIGLAPIVGAFAAGLVLDEVQFKSFAEPTLVRDVRGTAQDLGAPVRARFDAVIERHARRHLEELVAPVGYVLVPIFFVFTGLQVDLATMLDTSVLLAAGALTIVAFAGKLLAGIGAGRGVARWVVGWGMAPRGEVGLIFAATGKALNVIPESVFSMLIVVVLLTTLITPPVLVGAIRRAGVTDAPASAPTEERAADSVSP